MNKVEAEGLIYRSFLRAEAHQQYDARDAHKRNPALSKEVIESLCATPCVVVTGSKGKGSVAEMVSQILQTSMRVGLMTSPHIIDFCERFKVNGISISDNDFIRHAAEAYARFETIDNALPQDVYISPMALQAALALQYFNEQKTDFNVFECGKGARYDDVNNILHDYAIINTIFLEHTRELGSTLQLIASDKASVINGKQKCVFVAEQTPEVLEVIMQQAHQHNTPIKVYGTDFYATNIAYTRSGMCFDVVVGAKTFSNLSLPLMGEHQARNCALAMALAVDVLAHIDEAALRRNLGALSRPGRMEVISNNPFIMLDACINGESCEHVKQVIAHLQLGRCTTIIGIPADKDYIGVAKAMQSVSQRVILTQSHNPHYRFASHQCSTLALEGIEAIWAESITEAIAEACQAPHPIVILGTTSLITEVKKWQQGGDVVVC